MWNPQAGRLSSWVSFERVFQSGPQRPRAWQGIPWNLRDYGVRTRARAVESYWDLRPTPFRAEARSPRGARNFGCSSELIESFQSRLT
jgi:hypothetical protein